MCDRGPAPRSALSAGTASNSPDSANRAQRTGSDFRPSRASAGVEGRKVLSVPGMCGSQSPRRSRAAHASQSCRRARPSRDRTRPIAGPTYAALHRSRASSSSGSGSGKTSACPQANRKRALIETLSPTSATRSTHLLKKLRLKGFV